MHMTFYTVNSDGPCKALVEADGQFFEVRSGWGEQEGWTNNHVATLLTDEEIASSAYDGDEMSDEEIAESFSEDEIAGIEEAVRKAM